MHHGIGHMVTGGVGAWSDGGVADTSPTEVTPLQLRSPPTNSPTEVTPIPHQTRHLTLKEGREPGNTVNEWNAFLLSLSLSLGFVFRQKPLLTTSAMAIYSG